MSVQEIKNHAYWPKFLQYALDNNIDLDHVDDWKPWWDCFYAGVTAVAEKVATSMRKWANDPLGLKEE